ncbi:hypothetical protein COV05_03890 [Candidatus Uhrbacteria bacterium CG10_big_fil_rev_8_21_14_0_10_48_16]|uniref:Glycosyltransferase 2-like domain-containing protein n=1 Tax=Candidatus Uhrbacteria bacterium CG10_big_fil_rev_8_21_14_0_10_48_16 TaxID=1975038 RepID=A0A2M8LGA1_9BACT|nr:MAG: hypothetical protein COV05_03890 [Candidatus Uhrbacteria bacterium CG10_big_fil_rev_8_21_14_0_10_48_16]
MNRISVIIPTYQHAKTLPRVLDSVKAQSRLPNEIIVVDDGSTDRTKEVLKPYMPDITYLYQANQGAPMARNAGFAESTGDLVIFWDADVVGESCMLESLERALNGHPDASWAYASFFWGKTLFQGKTFDPKALRINNYIHTSSLIRRGDFPGFDPALKRFQDWDLWLTMSEQGKKGIFVDERLYRILVETGRPALSTWMPKMMYNIPWNRLGWMPKRMKDYQASRAVIVTKHHL